jgi:predicted peroxiredoxin
MKKEDALKLGILLARGPETPDARWALDLARAAARRGWPVEVFFMNDGVEFLRGPESDRSSLDGIRMTVCTQSVVERDLPTDDPDVDYAGQVQLGRLMGRSDRFLSFA